MSELENVNGGVGCKKKKLFLITGTFQSLGQVLGYDDCYDSGTSSHDLKYFIDSAKFFHTKCDKVVVCGMDSQSLKVSKSQKKIGFEVKSLKKRLIY